MVAFARESVNMTLSCKLPLTVARWRVRCRGDAGLPARKFRPRAPSGVEVATHKKSSPLRCRPSLGGAALFNLKVVKYEEDFGLSASPAAGVCRHRRADAATKPAAR